MFFKICVSVYSSGDKKLQKLVLSNLVVTTPSTTPSIQFLCTACHDNNVIKLTCHLNIVIVKATYTNMITITINELAYFKIVNVHHIFSRLMCIICCLLYTVAGRKY